jgi:hypothetical protein
MSNKPSQLVHQDVHAEYHVQVVNQDEQLVQPADHVHDALVVSATQLQPELLDRELPSNNSRRSLRKISQTLIM